MLLFIKLLDQYLNKQKNCSHLITQTSENQDLQQLKQVDVPLIHQVADDLYTVLERPPSSRLLASSVK